MNIRYINPNALDVAALNSIGWYCISGSSCELGAYVDDQDRFSDLVTQVFQAAGEFPKRSVLVTLLVIISF